MFTYLIFVVKVETILQKLIHALIALYKTINRQLQKEAAKGTLDYRVKQPSF